MTVNIMLLLWFDGQPDAHGRRATVAPGVDPDLVDGLSPWDVDGLQRQDERPRRRNLALRRIDMNLETLGRVAVERLFAPPEYLSITVRLRCR